MRNVVIAGAMCALAASGRRASSSTRLTVSVADTAGDDTSMNTTPAQLLDRDEACRLLDGTRITCQADSVAGQAVKSCYQDFVPYTDVFLPEVYWVYWENRAQDEACVAKVIADVDRCRSDIAKYGKGRPHGIWPIVQAFHGRMWHRFPDEDEFLAMSYASIIHGGHGEGSVAWEKRRIRAAGGSFEDDFKGFGVHVYRFMERQP